MMIALPRQCASVLGWLVVLSSVILAAGPDSVRRYEYTATVAGNPIYKIFYTITPATDSTGNSILETRIEGADRHEESRVVFGSDDRLKQVSQVTQTDRASFKWDIEIGQMSATANFVDVKIHESQQSQFKFPSNGYPIQAFIYLLQQSKFRSQAVADIQLLVPPHKFYPLVARVKGDETINIRSKPVLCQRVQVRIAGVIGKLGPKYVFWIDKQTGVPVRYLDGDAVVELD